jgi:hypothetical protein
MARVPYSSPLVESAVVDLDKKFKDAFENLKKEIRKQVQALNRDGQVLVRDRFNMARIREIVNQLKQTARDTGFGDVLDSSANSLVKMAEGVLDEAGGHGLPAQFSQTTGADLENLITGTQRAILHHETTVARDIERILLRSATGSTDWKDLVDRIESQMDIRRDQALTTAQDAVSTFHTHTRVTHFEEAGVEWFLYDGPRDARNRDFCSRFVRTRVTMEILNEHSIERSHPLPASISLGGWNCRHELVPLVTQQQINRWPIGPR